MLIELNTVETIMLTEERYLGWHGKQEAYIAYVWRLMKPLPGGSFRTACNSSHHATTFIRILPC